MPGLDLKVDVHRSTRRNPLHLEKQKIGGGAVEGTSWAKWQRRDELRQSARFLSSLPPFGETTAWKLLPARFRSGCVVIGSAQES
nr:hypothetical protein Itr_chr08CG16000 [Ipomoea trifida]